MVDGDGICGCTHYIYNYMIYAIIHICNMQKKTYMYIYYTILYTCTQARDP